MKVVLFCKKPYAFGIMMPLFKILQQQNHEVMWYFPKDLENKIPTELKASRHCSTMKELLDFNAEANFAPGNDFPYYLPGVKVQIFHGMAGEKSGHFHIRHYFDLYLTQGPYFTNRFNALAKKYKNFDVQETGWCKLDTLFQKQFMEVEKLQKPDYKKIILYAPTFSPSLTSASKFKQAIIDITNNKDYFLYVKFHDKMDKQVIKEYTQKADSIDNMEISTNSDIIPLLQTCDLMISDTSSVVYEYLLLDKPVITFKSTSENIRWDDLHSDEDFSRTLENNLNNDPYQKERHWFIENYHPFTDGNSASRMIEAAQSYIDKHGVPDMRKLSFLRRRKIHKTFGKKPFL